MKSLSRLFLLLLTGIFTFTGYAQVENVPLPIDSKIRYGQLENGLTYYIRHNEQPKDRADFYIVQNVGSILEEENQRGLAHFLEHMAFDGTKNFPDDEMTHFTERIGVRMGENMNAYTSFDETVYMLKDVPVTRQEIVDSCLLILHDWSGFITLADSAIEKERGVIREEWRTRQDAQARLWEQQLPKLYPGNRYGERMPIGTIDVIDNFKPDELRDYYKKWYRPDLQGIIIVGDIDMDQVENKIQNLFSDIPLPIDAAERPVIEIADNREPLVSIATDREATNILLYIFYKHNKMPAELYASMQGFTYDYVNNIIGAMLNERFAEILQRADPPFIFATAFEGDYMVSKTKGAWTAAALVEEGEIDTALSALVVEMERARKFGFTEAEYDRARVNLLKDYEVAYNERDKQKNSSYTSEYVYHFTNGGYIPGIEFEYEIINAVAPAIPVDEINTFFQMMIGDDNIAISLSGPDKTDINYPSEDELLRVFRAAHDLPIEPYFEEVSNDPLIPVLPTPGKVIKRTDDPLFGATILELSNGAKVVLKHTDFKKDEIIMTATSPGGSTLYGDEESPNLKVFNSVINIGGLGEFSAINLNKRLAGVKAYVTPTLGLKDENLNGSAVPGDIETLFQLIYLNFTSKRMDTEAYESYESRMKAQLLNQDLNPMVAFSDTLTKIVYNDNIRTRELEIEDFDQISYERIMEMYRERFADASDFVFTFVGNLDIDTMAYYSEQYIATLPSLNRKEEGNLSRAPRFANGIHINHFQREMETPRSVVYSMYSGTTEFNVKNTIIATILRQVLDLVYTEKIRKDESATYSVQSAVSISQFPEGQTYIQTYFDTDPEKKEQMMVILKEEIERMANEGPKADDFNKTKENMLKRYEENQEENGYWLGILDNYYYKGLDAYTSYLPLLKSVTPEDVRQFARHIINAGNYIEVNMNP